jgi:quercetin dioxygenase-like cupin family protein
MDRQTFEAELARDGYTCVENSMAANHHNPDHTHDFSARLFVLSGQISVTFDGSTKTCGAGDTFALQAGILHAEQVGPDGVEYVAGRK